jgi:hypothetical protein
MAHLALPGAREPRQLLRRHRANAGPAGRDLAAEGEHGRRDGGRDALLRGDDLAVQRLPRGCPGRKPAF